ANDIVQWFRGHFAQCSHRRPSNDEAGVLFDFRNDTTDEQIFERTALVRAELPDWQAPPRNIHPSLTCHIWQALRYGCRTEYERMKPLDVGVGEQHGAHPGIHRYRSSADMLIDGIANVCVRDWRQCLYLRNA